MILHINHVENVFIEAKVLSKISEIAIPYLSGNEMKNVSFSFDPFPEGTHIFTFTVDPDDLIAESDETNNIETRTVNVRTYIKQNP